MVRDRWCERAEVNLGQLPRPAPEGLTRSRSRSGPPRQPERQPERVSLPDGERPALGLPPLADAVVPPTGVGPDPALASATSRISCGPPRICWYSARGRPAPPSQRPSPKVVRRVLCRASGRDLGAFSATVDAGALRGAIDSVDPLAQVRDALARSRTRRARGEIIARVRP
ncbi:zinc-binding dehydrogenase [Enhygromyxa salina]|uniref:zinc-binding dehydrogenase n=1 Tax=Enhygromyxa salina TaxID=215803 RepID=UPI0015E60929